MDILAQGLVNLKAAKTEPLQLSILKDKACTADILRLDQIHPVISGNKWFKLKYYLEAAVSGNASCIISFGGAFSNHLHALAYAAKALSIPSIGFIRGERPAEISPVLDDLIAFGMKLQFISREEYRLKESQPFLDELRKDFPSCLVIPEGGAGPEGIKGASDILSLVAGHNYTHILCAVGTGTMLAGLESVAEPGSSLIGIPVLKGFPSQSSSGIPFINEYHFGGYAKHNAVLLDFMRSFYEETGIETDFVYTGKLLYAAADLLRKDFFPPGSRLLIIHSGGLSGNRSLPPIFAAS